MKILGLDPGTRHFGWGVVERVGNRHVHIAHGVVHAKESLSLGARLVIIEAALTALLAEHAPDAASVEAMFFAKDAQAAAKLGHARGVALLVCARAELEIFEYPPARVKRTVTGHGRAEKSAVAFIVQRALKLDEPPKADAADALAIAMTHLMGPLSRPGLQELLPRRRA